MLASEFTQGMAFHSWFGFGFSVFVLELDTLSLILSVGLTSVPLYLSMHTVKMFIQDSLFAGRL